MHQCQYLDSNECGGGVKPQPRRASGIQAFKLAYLHYNVNRTVHKLLQGCAPRFGPFPRRYYCRRRRSDTVRLRRVRVAGSLLLLSRRHTVVRGRAERMSSSVWLEAKVDIYWDAENSDHFILRMSRIGQQRAKNGIPLPPIMRIQTGYRLVAAV